MQIVEEHVRNENIHDLDELMRTFGADARYDVIPWGAKYLGQEQVRSFYDGILQGLPDLNIDVKQRYQTEEAVILEVIIRGTHTGTLNGIPPTGNRVEFPLCAIYTFTSEDRLAGEKIYFDNATLLTQLGALPAPQ